MNTKAQKIMLWTGMAFLLIYFAAVALLMGFIPPPSPALQAADVVQLYAHSNTQFRIGVVLANLTGGGYLLWSMALFAQMARHEKGIPLLAILQLLSAALGTIFIWGPPILWGVAAYSVGRDPALTLLMHQFAWLTFITPLSVFPLQVVPIVVIAFSRKDEESSAFPRWIGYLTLLIAVTGEVGVAPMMFNSGPFSWNGLPFYLPFGLFAIWVPALQYTLHRAITLQERAEAI